MSVLVCGGKLTYPIKVSTDKLGIIGVSYVEQLTGYLKYNQHIDKLIFLETVDNTFREEDLEGFTGDITVITNNPDKYVLKDESHNQEEIAEPQDELEEPQEDVEEPQEEFGLKKETIEKIREVKKLEGLRVSDVQWEIMNS